MPNALALDSFGTLGIATSSSAITASMLTVDTSAGYFTLPTNYNSVSYYNGGIITGGTGTSVTGTSFTYSNENAGNYYITVNGTASTSAISGLQWYVTDPLTNIKDFVKSRSLFKSKSRANPLAIASAQEEKARQLLRELLTEKEWRRYVTNQFIMVKGASGRWYQIFAAAHRLINVYERGQVIEQLCIHTDSQCPPSDHVVNMKVLVETDEDLVWRGSNKRGPLVYIDYGSASQANEQDNLVQYFKKLKECEASRKLTITNTYHIADHYAVAG